MESKYYVPQIEEFHVGFEYEELNLVSVQDEHWKVKVKKNVFEKEIWKTGYSNWNFLDKLEEGKIRVRVLDKEDIESLGFKHDVVRATGEHWIKDNLEIHRPYCDTRLCIINAKPFSSFRECVFAGEIKNKSELKKVLKMLHIE